VDLGAALVADGYARAYRHFSLDYLPQEDSARALGLGIWSSPSTRTPQQRCHIKGNISGAGQIYHRPGDPYYRSTHIDHNRGERWFCSVADAQSAGWRAPRNAKPR
jgi:hypothetical protein